MIYANKRVVTIDFKVLDSKEYTFFIDEELCKIKLERRGDEMYYFFEIDKETDTPLNRARWAREKKHLRQMLLTFGGMAVAVALVLIWSNWTSESDEARQMLTREGIETYGRITSLLEIDKGLISFQFIAQGSPQNGELNLKDNVRPVSDIIFPLEVGDEFVVRYVPQRPSINQMIVFRPTEKQIEKYQSKSLDTFLKENPDMTSEKAQCLLNLAYESEGLVGYALFYFHDILPSENANYNSKSFQEFFNSYHFQSSIKSRCPSE